MVGGLGYTGTGGLLPFVGNSGTHRQRLRSPGVGEGWQSLASPSNLPHKLGPSPSSRSNQCST